MKVSLIAVGLAIATPAFGQSGTPVTQQQTFEAIGRSLERANRALMRERPGTQSAPAVSSGGPALGELVKAELPVIGYSKPAVDSSAATVIEPGATLEWRGNKEGFVEVFSPSKQQVLYVPAQSAQAAFDIHRIIGDTVSEGINQGMAAIGDLASTLADNPYVKIKSFKVSVALSPSLDVEFEMKEPGAQARSPSP